MTASARPPRDDVADSDARELHALYREGREGSDAEPGATLDAAILAAARAELQAGRPASPRPAAAWWRRWLPATSAIAIALLGVSLTLRMLDNEERNRQTVLEPDAATSAESPASALPDHAATAAPPPGDRAEETRSVPPAGVAGSARAPVAARAETETRKSAKPAPAPPTPAATAAKADEPSLLRQRERAGEKAKIDSAESAPAASAPAQLQSQPNTESEALAGAHDAPALREADAAATPTAWVNRIRALQAAGRDAEARESLARLRARYPDYVLPDDLAALR